MKISILIFCLVSLFSQVLAGGPSKTERYGYQWKYIVYACNEAVEEYTFGVNASLGYYPKLCGYPPLTGSILNCAANYLGSESKNFQKSMKRVQTLCKEYGHLNYTIPELQDVYQNATQYLIDPESLTGNITAMKFYEPINISKESLLNSMSYYEYLYFNFDEASMLAGMMYLYFILIFIIFGAANFIKRLGFHRKFNNKVINWYRANISIPALFNGEHTEAPSRWKFFSTLIPTRAESIVVFFFIMLNLLLSTVHYRFAGYEMTSRFQAFTIFVADREGLIAFGLIPLLIIFAGRNNIITSLTGIPYTSMIVYHKWVARLMWLAAMIHSACWTSYAVNRGYLKSYYSETYWKWGVVATILGAFILIQAFHCFRNMSYEVFLVTHIILAILFIVGCWWHCYDMGWLEWIYASWAVWIFDRVLRVIRMCIFGFRNAEIELISDDTFKVSVKHGKLFAPFPGSYAYVYFITPTMFWQSHPFTIIDSAIEKDVTTIYIKTKAGITKRINKQLSKIPGNKKTIRVSIEGPYGHRAPMEKYDTALLLAGGNGIPGPYYHAIDLAKRESSTKQQIKLGWVIRNPEAILWFHDELKALQHTNIQTEIYITGKMPTDCSESLEKNISTDEKKVSTDSDSSKASSITEIIDSLSSHIAFHYGRPNLEEIIVTNFTDEAGPSVGVMTCGPPKMVDIVRALTAKHLQSAKGRIDLFEELQVW
ncbi:Ferric reductase transmembrane component [Wickerhamomyces ciferrii]|uniref:ferric-chelate reductase (NADPH) n=1 Tax=Wickerhamomyces ciferrii (strain ATCC 14091 / BCRC 22168 / CBS 111 / JCM 3599 / NBRC 0793 / NRRL Y-1031 F-60-10) TaxID=1206466 RepID=K0K8Z4_WICCF|nr:Ferric reductase transmembrane component [Wickerhamomyces ciferrii]CCH41325.1 Ferric reductase transmembrane component [Wickerhamomyces ciferrii]